MIGATFFVFGQRAAAGQQATGTIKLHSRSHYHGMWAAITSTLPALSILLVIVLGKNLLFQHWAALAKITNVVDGIKFGEVEPWVQSAGEAWTRWESDTIIVANVLVLGVSLTGGLLG